MIIDLNQDNLSTIKNTHLRAYAAIYARIYDDFMAQIARMGLEVDPHSYAQEVQEKKASLRQNAAVVRNAGKSVVLNHLSPACEACRKGIGTATFFISLQCHRDCFYCFNGNQEDYEYHTQHTRNVVHELEQIGDGGLQLDHIALTGGEPLLHKQEAIEFFKTAQGKFPAAYKRLYTCGDQVDEDTLRALQQTHLDEIRFSLRMHDSEASRRHIMERIALARHYVPNVMVEMPVLPGTLAEMQLLLKELDSLGITGINLLEFCFPLRNAEEFRQRGYKIKHEPFQVLYNYWYAGGLPVSRSEVECLELLDYAQREGLRLGVHYCSLENKHSGQIYQQNTHGTIARTGYLSQRDFFIKSAKVFGADIAKVERIFQKSGYIGYQRNPEHNFIEFHVSKIAALRKLDIEVAVSWSVLEMRDDGPYVRELKVSLAHPKTFDVVNDV
jgi:pyruvate formate-lyase activating enzyme-like uncharacterized protein